MNKLIFVPLFVSILSGCSLLSVGDAEFTCEAEGTCQSVREAYEGRYNSGVYESNKEEPTTIVTPKNKDGFFVDYRDGNEWLDKKPAENRSMMFESVVSDGGVVYAPDNTVALRVDHSYVREDSRLLSVLIMPYTDGGDTAHLGKEMVTEVIPRKWKISEVNTRNRAGVVPNKLKSTRAKKGK